jgi:hypothetical protein
MTVDMLAPKKGRFMSAVEGAAVMAAADKVITF